MATRLMVHDRPSRLRRRRVAGRRYEMDDIDQLKCVLRDGRGARVSVMVADAARRDARKFPRDLHEDASRHGRAACVRHARCHWCGAAYR
jgi:hypothetical protein